MTNCMVCCFRRRLYSQPTPVMIIAFSLLPFVSLCNVKVFVSVLEPKYLHVSSRDLFTLPDVGICRK